MVDEHRRRTEEERPGHPMFASVVLVSVVVLLIIALSLAGSVR